jgi:hypothetical protein
MRRSGLRLAEAEWTATLTATGRDGAELGGEAQTLTSENRNERMRADVPDGSYKRGIGRSRVSTDLRSQLR